MAPKDEALEKWIEGDMRDVPCAMPVDEAGEYMCRAAWYAATKHTLEYVQGEMLKTASEYAERGARSQSGLFADLARCVAKMKP